MRGIHGGLKDMVADPTLQRDRMLDLAVALTWAEQQCAHPYKVLFGHSMGSDTVVFEPGVSDKLGVHGTDHFDAYVALSPFRARINLHEGFLEPGSANRCSF